jgi:cytoskeleton protein RodZ
MNAAGSSDTGSNKAAPEGAVPAESLTPGELLRRERERRSITLQQAAEDLHLDTTVVEAIEANRFDLLGVPVYARGHLRRYAQLLGLSPQFIIQRYEALIDRPAVPTPVPASASTVTSVELERRSHKGRFWLAIALVALALGWWLLTVFNPAKSTEQPAVTAEPSAEASTSSEPVEPEVVSMSSAVPMIAAVNAAPVAGDVRLRLQYSDASWTEIYDASGKRLMFGLGESGRARTVSGTPPLRVTLGNASVVTVQVNDSAVVVPRQARRDSARFMIAANGAVQAMSGEVSVE